jgi:MFS family permease
LEQPQGPSGSESWFSQFPAPLQELAMVRLIAALGAGGVIYLTPLVFHQAGFSAAQVTSGLALAALAGTGGRLLCGALLDRGLRCSVPVLLAAASAMAGDTLLALAHAFPAFAVGQGLLGIAAGLYWPASELAVPLTCPPVPSARAFVLVRTADAAGIALGALAGAALAAADRLRGIYGVDIACLLVLVLLLLWRPLPEQRPDEGHRGPIQPGRWLPQLAPLLLVTLLATAMPALMQSALPLDLVQGGLRRPALAVAPGALTIGLQLGLLLLLQWPVGRALARRPVSTGLALSLICFVVGSVLLALSALLPWGLLLVLAAQVPLALGGAAFLPTATEAVVELTPPEHRGMAMALYSQCFAISAVLAPLLAGALLENQRHGAGLWMGMATLLLAGLNPVRRLRRQLGRDGRPQSLG